MKSIILVLLAVCTACAIFASCSGKSQKEITEVQDTTLTNVTHVDWASNAVIYEMNVRQYSKEGTFKGCTEQLGRVRALGVDIIWLMPINPISVKNRKGGLGSYYAVADYEAVNPEFGTMQDFKAFVDKAHSLGMKVIIDWVPNHTGCDNKWVTEHPDWYARNENGQMYGPYDWTDTYQLDYSKPALREAMTKAMIYWLQEADIDGFRCDVASRVPIDFWNELRPKLDKVKHVFMLAEADKPNLTKNCFDMVYNWPLCGLFTDISATLGENSWAKKKGENHPTRTLADIDSLYANLDKNFPGDTYFMNMTSNHDQNSWEGTEFERFGKCHKIFAVLSYTLPGMPLIYTGQEVANDHALEFFVRDPIKSWVGNDYTQFYTTLNKIKHDYTCLGAGSAGAPMVRFKTDDPNIFIFSRTDSNGTIFVFVNANDSKRPVTYINEGPLNGKRKVNLFTEELAEFPRFLEPWEYLVIGTE